MKRGGEINRPTVKSSDINSEAIQVREPDERKRERQKEPYYYNSQDVLALQESRVITSHPMNSFLLIIYLQTHFPAKIKLGDKWNQYSDPK